MNLCDNEAYCSFVRHQQPANKINSQYNNKNRWVNALRAMEGYINVYVGTDRQWRHFSYAIMGNQIGHILVHLISYHIYYIRTKNKATEPDMARKPLSARQRERDMRNIMWEISIGTALTAEQWGSFSEKKRSEGLCCARIAKCTTKIQERRKKIIIKKYTWQLWNECTNWMREKANTHNSDVRFVQIFRFSMCLLLQGFRCTLSLRR